MAPGRLFNERGGGGAGGGASPAPAAAGVAVSRPTHPSSVGERKPGGTRTHRGDLGGEGAGSPSILPEVQRWEEDELLKNFGQKLMRNLRF